MRVLAFGASVAAQKGESGYVENLKKFLNSTGHDFHSLGFGACHFNEAGFYNFPKIFEFHPDVCLFEWNTTGLNWFDEGKLESVIIDCVTNKILPVFLILPRVSVNIIDRPCEIQCFNFSRKYNIPLLDLRHLVDSSGELILRDDVHTNILGAELYANSIFDFLNSSIFPALDDIISAILNQASDFKRLSVESYRFDAGCELNSFEFSFVLNSHFNGLAIEHFIGPYSGIFELTIKGISNGFYNNFLLEIFDPWCYYERVMWHNIFDGLSGELINDEFSLSLKISSIVPNYDLCTKDDFKPHEFLFIKPLSFHYCGMTIFDLNQVANK